MRPAKPLAVVVGFVVAVLGWLPATGLPASAAPSAAPTVAAVRTATLVGSLQSELGCPGDWDPGCTTTDLLQQGTSNTYTAQFAVPEGAWDVKVAINHDWPESYGLGGGSDNIPLTLQGPATLNVTYDDATHLTTFVPAGLSSHVTAADKALAKSSLRSLLTKERFYFVMADRFANGSTANDLGGLTGDRLSTGFDPTDKGFFHGGDLQGITQKLDYIKGLGTTAIWLTPSFKNRPVAGGGSDVSAGYHGYWITDFTRIDPHLGTNAQMKTLINAAHNKGMKVFFDIITNHTADIIDYQNPADYAYRDKATYPYTRSDTGAAFDDRDYASSPTFPPMSAATSFPYVPTFRTPADATVKVPAWLNDPTMYHNRGNTSFTGENSEYGDFLGLDDLFTERPEVVKGMGDIYKAWVDLGIDGFRIDTVKHVNMAFWQQFSPDVLAHARAIGNPDFFMFGEVFDSSAKYMSQFSTTGKLPATLDFGFQSNAVNFAAGKETTALRDFFATDDYYTDTDSNVYESPTFLGNHDMGRAARKLQEAGVSDSELMARTQLANSLMYLTRGQPVVYYGDEQGFIGAGGDKDARQDMFATQVATFAAEPILGGTSGAKNRYSTHAPLYQQIKKLAALRAANPALGNGAQIHRYASSSAGIYAFSRIDRAQGIEYVIVANNSTSSKTANFDVYNKNQYFAPLMGGAGVTSGPGARVTVTVPALSVRVFKAGAKLAARPSAPSVYLTMPGPGDTVKGRAKITAGLTKSAFAQVTFVYRPVGTTAWTQIGTDDNAPYAVYHDVSGIPAGTLLEYRAIVKDSSGNFSAASSAGIVAPAPSGVRSAKRAASIAGTPGGAPKADIATTKAATTGSVAVVAPAIARAGTATDATVRATLLSAPAGAAPAGTTPAPAAAAIVQPAQVSVPGTHNSEMGCAGDWDPACDQAQLTLDPKDQIWKGTFTLPAGTYDYKAAINKAWTESYGLHAGPGNISYTTTGGEVTFFYDHATHWVTSTAEGPIITAPGSMQSELGCPADWQPDCMLPWVQDVDGDGTYTYSTDAIPAGSYEMKIAHDRSWDVNYGAGGVLNGPNIAFTVPNDGVVVTITYVLATHQITVTTSASGAFPDLKKAKAFWVAPNLLAWPKDAIPAAANPALLKWRLHWSPTASLTIDAEDLPGGTSAGLAYDPAGLPASLTKAHPELTGYVALRLGSTVGKQAGSILRGQVAVAMYANDGSLMDATGVQTAIVLDSLYATSAGRRTFGVTFSTSPPTYRVWAPTATKVTLLTWSPTAPADAPAGLAKRTAMARAADGSWSAKAGVKNARYLYEVQVYVRSTGKIETTLVTDPYSTALTLNSTKSVAVNLRDAAYRPVVWNTAKAPVLKQRVDTTIYELQVRDFSISDPTVSAGNRGSYLAFAENGNGTKHLKALAAAGLNTVHLLPTFDIASIQEDPARQASTTCDLLSYPADSDQQQACIDAIRADDAFNWGYDPWHWMAPEGSYASSAATADGGKRVAEFRTMVGALHRDGLRVVLDQVFNHTPTSGLAPTSVLDKMVPDYYQRLNAVGDVWTSTCCQNVATEHALAQKIMVDAVVMWARDYRIDGFRFDLMGHHSKANLLAVRKGLDALTVANSGVNGKAIYLYGEGWNFGEVADNALFTQATQGQLAGTHIGTFSDRLRDAVRGGGPFDEDPRVQGFGSGEFTDSNGAAVNADAQARLKHDTDLVQLGLAGNLKAFSFRLNDSGVLARGDQVDYNGAPAGYATNPDEVITYVDAHDNETLFDALTFKLPEATTMADRVRMNTLSLSTTALSQTPSFWHAGTDLLRSKSLDRNSYDSGDWFNTLDWTGVDNGFGHGLPLKGDNEAKWPYMRPLLGNPALKPSASDVATATARAQDLLKLRFSTRLFRLGSAAAINAKVSFPASGTADALPGVIAMRIDDTIGADMDPALKGLVVVFNATPGQVTQPVAGTAGLALSLSSIQAAGTDPVVKTATWNAAAGSATVPPRTVAVFVQR